MKRRITNLAFISLVVLISIVFTMTSPAYADGAVQISGEGNFDDGSCEPNPDYHFASILTGDLDGCLYAKVESAKCSSGGVYQERGENLFVGTYNEFAGTFEATYHFVAKFEVCDVETATFGGAEFHGRCHHPIKEGSGTGVFEGVTGRLDFKDNVVDGEVINFPYRGHLKK